jgi:hypothetical protein
MKEPIMTTDAALPPDATLPPRRAPERPDGLDGSDGVSASGSGATAASRTE